jgi:hypothetical protein
LLDEFELRGGFAADVPSGEMAKTRRFRFLFKWFLDIA